MIFLGIVWYSMVLSGIACHCLVLLGADWCCLVLSGTAWYCLILPGAVWYCRVLFGQRGIWSVQSWMHGVGVVREGIGMVDLSGPWLAYLVLGWPIWSLE